jgi:hypothetical protein
MLSSRENPHRALSRKLDMWTLRSPVLNLTVSERDTILRPGGRADRARGLRDLLLASQAWQLRERL